MIAANGVVGGSNPLNAAGGILHYHIDAIGNWLTMIICQTSLHGWQQLPKLWFNEDYFGILWKYAWHHFSRSILSHSSSFNNRAHISSGKSDDRSSIPNNRSPLGISISQSTSIPSLHHYIPNISVKQSRPFIPTNGVSLSLKGSLCLTKSGAR